MHSLNLNISGLPKSATLAINDRSKELQRIGRKIYKFGLGQSPFPIPDTVCRKLQENAYQKDYLPVEGLPELRKAVAEYQSRKNDQCTYTADQVLIGPGSKELMFLIQLVYYGDLVIPIPSWVSYAPQAQIIGRHVRWLPTYGEHNWMLSAETLEKHCRNDPNRPRLVILNYPSNPTGTSFSDEQLQSIANVARKYQVVILSDEIYGELHHDGTHKSISSYYPEGTIISHGLSKWCGAGGWRLGAFVFPETHTRLMDGMAVAASETFTSTSAPIQYAAVAAYRENPEIEKYLQKVRHILKMLRTHLSRMLESVGIKVPRAEGGFYLFPDFSPFSKQLAKRSVINSNDLCEYLLERTGLACLPGSVFGCPASVLALRLAYVDFDGVKAMQLYDKFHNDGRLSAPVSNNVIMGKTPCRDNETVVDSSDELLTKEEAFLNEACPNVMEGVRCLVDEVNLW